MIQGLTDSGSGRESHLKRYAAEFIAAFFIVFAVTAAIVADQHLAVVQVRQTFGILGVALAYGLALAAVVAALGRVSAGYGNPAVSLALYISKRLTLKDLGGHVAGQVLGGLLAAVLVRQLFDAQTVASVGAGAPALADGTTLLQGGLIEVVLTFFLVFVIWGVAVDPRGPRVLAPFAIGLTLSFGVLIGGPFTGGALNPARWFGPAVLGEQLDANWPVWVLGPIVGALIASTAYELFFLELGDSEDSPAPDALEAEDEVEEPALESGPADPQPADEDQESGSRGPS